MRRIRGRRAAHLSLRSLHACGAAAVSLLATLTACGGAVRLQPAETPVGARLAPATAEWVEQTLAGLSLRRKVAQLLMPRIGPGFMTVGSDMYNRAITWVEEMGVGGLIATLGPPLETAHKLDLLQQHGAVPLLIAADMEHGAGQLLDGGVVLPYGIANGGAVRFPPAMGLGATGDERYARELGRITALEAKAVGVHLDFAPVLDVNNNPANPIINTRSFGASPALVARMGRAMIDGLQSNGVLAVAKHFPGHGDTQTDSHIELPIITAPLARLDSIELLPYRAAIEAGVAGIMSAHIAFPALTRDSLPATLSPALMTGLLRDSLGFRGLVVTDALDMGAITSGWGTAEASVRALEAGADLLLQLPGDDVGAAIDAIVEAVETGRLDEARIDRSVRRILEVKAAVGLDHAPRLDLGRLALELATPEYRGIADEATARSITLVRDRAGLVPLPAGRILSITYRDDTEPFAGRAFNAELAARPDGVETVTLEPDAGLEQLAVTRARAETAQLVIFSAFVGVGAYQGRIAIAEHVAGMMRDVARNRPVIVVAFGSPYLLDQIPEASTYLLAWAGWPAAQIAAARALLGAAPITGRLPIPLPPHHALGDGITVEPDSFALQRAERGSTVSVPADLPRAEPAEVGFDARLNARIDSIVKAALADSVAPGAAVAVGRRGRLVHLRGYGQIDYASDAPPATDSTLWDLASLTKVIATTTAVMMLVDEGRIRLDAPLSTYLQEWPATGPKAGITVGHLLRHDGGLAAFGPIWKTARGRTAFLEQIIATPLEYEPGQRTLYSDYGAILLGFIVERVSGLTLDRFFQDRIAAPLGLRETLFRPAHQLGVATRSRVAPTEIDTVFRKTHVHGYVHDENAYALGGVAGHAGLFGSARDLAVFAAMLQGGGTRGGRALIARETVDRFTTRQSNGSSRALGWDTPSGRSSAGDYFSARSFGHTGFTGTSLWIDPERDVFLVILTNRVNPTRANQRHVRLRRDLADAVQQSITDVAVTAR